MSTAVNSYEDAYKDAQMLLSNLKKQSPEHLDVEMYESLVQHLLDLGYLKEPDHERDDIFVALGEDPGLLPRALARMRAEMPYRSGLIGVTPAKKLPKKYWSNYPPAEYDSSGIPNMPDEMEMQHIASFTSFDKDEAFLLTGCYSEGRVDPATRSIHYRLSVLGFYDLPVETPVGPETRQALMKLYKLLSFSSLSLDDAPLLPDTDTAIQEALCLLTDAIALSDRFRECHGWSPLVVCDKTTAVHNGSFEEAYQDLLVIGDKFTSIKDLFFLKTLTATQRGRYAIALDRRGDATGRLNSMHNELGIRLLQLKLWIFGYYEGRVDGIWGPITCKALAEAIEFEGGEMSDALRPVTGSLIAVNAPFVFGILPERFDIPEKSLREYEEAIKKESEYLVVHETENDRIEMETNKKKDIFTQIWDSLRGRVRKAVALGRRIYHGVKSVMLSAIRGVMNGGRWIVGSLKKIGAAAINLVKTMFTRIWQGISLIAKSLPHLLHFVFREPIVSRDKATGAFVLTRFDFDADVVFYVSDKAENELVIEHSKLCRDLTRASTLLLVCAVKAVKIAIKILSGPGGWLLLAYEIGKELFDLVFRYGKQGEMGTTFTYVA